MRLAKLVVLLLPVTLAVACDDDSTGQARVYMNVSSNASAAALTSASASLVSSMSAVSLSEVDSLYIKLIGVAVLKQGGDPESETSAWVTVQLADSAFRRINVLQLADDDSLLIAKGDLDVGTYKNLRLMFDSATIVLKNDLTVGEYQFLAGTPYTLRVPSGIVKLPLASFEIGADSVSTLSLELREQPSLANIVATGSGTLQMTPVLHVK